MDLQKTSASSPKTAAPAVVEEVKKEKKKGFFARWGFHVFLCILSETSIPKLWMASPHRLFSAKSKDKEAEAAPAPAPKAGKPNIAKLSQAQALDDIAKKSREVQQASSVRIASKSMDLMGDLTDEFHALKDAAAAKSPAAEKKKAGEVWD